MSELDDWNTDWDKQLDEVFGNIQIQEYFKKKSVRLKDFITCYMQVDMLLQKQFFQQKEMSPDDIFNKLSNLENKMQSLEKTVTHTHQNLNQNLNSYQEKVTMHVQNIQNKIQHITDYELRKSLSEIKTSDKQDLHQVLETFYDKIMHINIKTLNDMDKSIIQNISSSILNLNQQLTQTIQNHNQINKIQDTLLQLHNNFTGNSNKKGEYAENILYNNLCAEFSSAEVIETRTIPHSGDFMIKRENHPTIIIESKNFSTNVVKRDIDKFYSDIQLNDCCGIMLNAFGGICNKENYEIEVQGKNILIFIHNYEFDISHVRMAVNIIYNVFDIIKDQVSDKVEMMHKTFNALKIEYNGFMQTYRHHLENIKVSVNSLQQLQFVILDEFFKRRRVLKAEETFKCPICNRKFTTKRSLDRHYNTIHKNDTQKTDEKNKKSRKNKKSTNEEDQHQGDNQDEHEHEDGDNEHEDDHDEECHDEEYNEEENIKNRFDDMFSEN
jgi:uncharacterized C2H2 Zn-finger protein